MSLIFITFHSCFLSIIYAEASYLANDLATETSTYTYICLYLPVYVPPHHGINVQPSCFFFSSSCLLSARAARQYAYASSGCYKKKITLYRKFFRNLNFKNIVIFFKRTCCKSWTLGNSQNSFLFLAYNDMNTFRDHTNIDEGRKFPNLPQSPSSSHVMQYNKI